MTIIKGPWKNVNVPTSLFKREFGLGSNSKLFLL